MRFESGKPASPRRTISKMNIRCFSTVEKPEHAISKYLPDFSRMPGVVKYLLRLWRHSLFLCVCISWPLHAVSWKDPSQNWHLALLDHQCHWDLQTLHTQMYKSLWVGQQVSPYTLWRSHVPTSSFTSVHTSVHFIHVDSHEIPWFLFGPFPPYTQTRRGRGPPDNFFTHIVLVIMIIMVLA